MVSHLGSCFLPEPTAQKTLIHRTLDIDFVWGDSYTNDENDIMCDFLAATGTGDADGEAIVATRKRLRDATGKGDEGNKKQKAACADCNRSKSKCVFQLGASGCDRCTRMNLECVPHLSRQGKRKAKGQAVPNGHAVAELTVPVDHAQSNASPLMQRDVLSGRAYRQGPNPFATQFAKV